MASLLRLIRDALGHYSSDCPPFVLYLIHIPKTGGTTVDALIRQRVNAWRCSPLLGPADLLRLSPVRLERFDFISGHLEFGYHLGSLISRPVRPIVFLREPRSLLLSMYKQLWKDPADPLRPYVEKHCADMEMFFHDPVVSAAVADFQVRYLALAERRLDPQAIAAIRAASTKQAIEQAVRQAHEREATPSRKQLLARAIQRLGECWFLGLSECMDASMDDLAARLGWPPFSPVPRLNESPDRRRAADLPASLLRRLDELSVLDQALYAEAARRYDGAVARQAA